MAVLTPAKRKNIPDSQFAGPNRSYPIPDLEHARLALSGASRALHVGNISAATAAKIKAKARKKLGKPFGSLAPSDGDGDE